MRSPSLVFNAVVQWVQGSDMWTQVLVRRFLITLGMLIAVYVSSFAANPRLYLSHLILEGRFMLNPYDVAYTRVVGQSLTGMSGPSANTSIFADGYTNAGLLGILAIGVVADLLLAVIDDAAHGLALTLSCPLLPMPSYVLSNSALTTTLLTHGLGLALVRLALAHRSRTVEPSRPHRQVRLELEGSSNLTGQLGDFGLV